MTVYQRPDAHAAVLDGLVQDDLTAAVAEVMHATVLDGHVGRVTRQLSDVFAIS